MLTTDPHTRTSNERPEAGQPPSTHLPDRREAERGRRAPGRGRYLISVAAAAAVIVGGLGLARAAVATSAAESAITVVAPAATPLGGFELQRSVAPLTPGAFPAVTTDDGQLLAVTRYDESTAYQILHLSGISYRTYTTADGFTWDVTEASGDFVSNMSSHNGVTMGLRGGGDPYSGGGSVPFDVVRLDESGAWRTVDGTVNRRGPFDTGRRSKVAVGSEATIVTRFAEDDVSVESHHISTDGQSFVELFGVPAPLVQSANGMFYATDPQGTATSPGFRSTDGQDWEELPEMGGYPLIGASDEALWQVRPTATDDTVELFVSTDDGRTWIGTGRSMATGTNELDAYELDAYELDAYGRRGGWRPFTVGPLGAVVVDETTVEFSTDGSDWTALDIDDFLASDEGTGLIAETWRRDSGPKRIYDVTVGADRILLHLVGNQGYSLQDNEYPIAVLTLAGS